MGEKRDKIPGPKALRVINTMKKHAYDSTFMYSLVISHGHNCIIEDIDGNKYLDFTSNIGACPLGYSHPDIIETLAQYSSNGTYKIAGQDFYCQEHADLAEDISKILPSGFKTFFINSGAEAVENAIKIAYRKKGPLPGISCIGAFHGRTLGALSFTASRPVHKYNFPEFPSKRIKFCTRDDDPEIDAIEDLLKENKIAFIMTEIIQGEGGYNVASKKFVSNLRKFATRYGVPLILDEVQSGIGHTGKWWAFEHYNIRPDIMTSAKALQIGATAFDKKYEPATRSALSSTWGGGNRIDMAVGSKVIQVIKRDKLLENATKMGNMLRKGLSEMIGKKGIVDVRGLGLMIGVEFDTAHHRDKKLSDLFKHGLLTLGAGQKSMRIIPPLIITKEQIHQGLDIMHQVLMRN
ncbi:putative Acetylornithine aminotransferase [Nitrosotalea sinensis]|jgi:4-aminobutyrate aminotransferase|uniref:Putative Acetylornithine aminotransferase n=1 Tax=Nitrosotalea sinensis TaxID=1499975 RepID=A0A2H1EJ29_9ARCH|nr:aminotransferase class III-fold pyridoxal phosphate-dependent enzyme [Candidatus Nitrosotalea sinensis]SHO48044.1 putative Acetylornithine aminotransferase [Candidatus Nitrosotalea sinensis]